MGPGGCDSGASVVREPGAVTFGTWLPSGMCGRYALTKPPEVLAALLHVRWMRFDLVPRYNIAPTQVVAGVRSAADGGRELVGFRWGLIPSWAKEKAIGSRLINARSETVATTPAFRGAFRHRRCVVPATGFYEWKKLEGTGRKQPFFIQRRDGQPMVLAGLWESWSDRETGELIESCTILTTEPNATVSPLHDRMPVILDEGGWTTWLEPGIESPEALKAVLRPAPDDALVVDPVSPRVNSPRQDDPSLIEPVAADSPEGSTTPDRRESGGGLFD